MFSVQLLLFGPHGELARRCLQSVVQNLGPQVDEIRIGMNAVSADTVRLVNSLCRDISIPVWVYRSQTNVWKYPLMRRMFYDPVRPVSSEYICWLDDDSYFKSIDLSRWARYHELLQESQMLGALYKRALVGRMAEQISQQPWYTGQPCHFDSHGRPAMLFATGGWWVTHKACLAQWDWPWPELKHSGGDCTLGELFHQQGWGIQNFNDGVAINADVQGRQCRAKPRAPHQPLLWAASGDVNQTNFQLEVTQIGQCKT